jgi:hypothetical protein
MERPMLSNEIELQILIENSIIERYEGDLERHETESGEITYIPLDVDNIHDLLTTGWGEYVAADTLEQIFKNLTEDGAEKWPKAYCEEDLDYEREQRASLIDYDIACAEVHLEKLKTERDELIALQCDRAHTDDKHRLTD